MTDEELTLRLIAKDNLAFRELVQKYQSMVYKACYNLLNQSQDAEDIAQEVFIEVFESISQFRQQSKLSTWLYRITINKSLNHLRKNKWKNLVNSIEQFFVGDKNANLEIEDKSANDSPYSIDYLERGKVLQTAIDSLPENQKIAFTLNKFDELSYQEITEIMDLSLASVESLIHRAKINLQKKLIDYYKN
ncbi:MAG TPA: sigma-70 family RNA polymerase sigma factor [Bacteroidales bacterium]